MKFRGTPTYGGGAMYKLMGSVHEGLSGPQPGDARIELGGNAARDDGLRRADAIRERLSAKDIRATLGKPELDLDKGWMLPLGHDTWWALTDAQAATLNDQGKREWLQANRLGATLVRLNAGLDLEELLHDREDSTDAETVVPSGFASGGGGG